MRTFKLAFAAILSFISLPLTVQGQSNITTSPADSSSSELPTGIISIVAGSINGNFSGDGGPATDAVLTNPNSVALDSAGNLYIADTINSVIRIVTRSTGIITTIAGQGGVFGSSGDGGPATSAKLSYPSGIALDSSGNIFIADSSNCVIRRVDAKTNIITTIAGQLPNPAYPSTNCGYGGDGGLATAAKLNYPDGIALDSSGDIYVADTRNRSVRKINAKSRIVTTIAGICDPTTLECTIGFSGDGGPATKATLAAPVALALDAGSNIYIADEFNNRIRHIDAETGIITTVAGGCVPDSSGDCSDEGYTPDGGLATKATLFDPQGVAVDPFGNLIFSDSQNDLVRRVDAKTGILTTVAGSYGWVGFYHNGGPATDAGLQDPTQIAYDSSGNLYIADNADQAIRLVTGSTTPAARTPVISPAKDVITSPTLVTIKDASPNSVIYYTIDGTVPSTNSQIYSKAFKLSGSAAVTAFATSPSLANSTAAVSDFTYEIPAAAPVIFPPAGTYTTAIYAGFTDTVSGVIFHYTTDGSTPTAKSQFFNGNLPISASTTLKVIAIAEGYLPSPVTTAVYTIDLPTLPVPTISPKAGAYSAAQYVSISVNNNGANLYYTLDGSTPVPPDSLHYTGPIFLTRSSTVKAIAVAVNYRDSPVAAAVYTITLPVLPAPTPSLPAGTYAGPQTLQLKDAHSGASIYFTLDGTNPTQNSTLYSPSQKISIAKSTTVKAIAIEAGFTTSTVATAKYTLLPPPSVTTGIASAISTSTATVSGTVNSEGLTGGWWFAYGTNPAVLSSKSVPHTLSTTSSAQPVSLNLTGLPAKTTIYYQLVAKTTAGTSQGKVASFVTH